MPSSRGACGCGCEFGQSGLNQVGDGGVVHVHGDGEGSKAVVKSETGVSAHRKQRTDHVNEPLLTGCEESCAAVQGSGIVESSSSRNQHIDDLHVTILGGLDQRRISSKLVRGGLVDIGPSSDEALNDSNLPILTGYDQSRAAVLRSGGVHLSASLKQSIHNLHMALLAGNKEGKEPVIAEIVHVRAPLRQQLPHRVQLPETTCPINSSLIAFFAACSSIVKQLGLCFRQSRSWHRLSQ